MKFHAPGTYNKNFTGIFSSHRVYWSAENKRSGGDTMEEKTSKAWFDSGEFEERYHCDDPLGAFCGEQGTCFRLWAPTAQQVAIRLYQAGNNAPAIEKIFLEKGGKGTWLYTTTRNLSGWYYDYEVTLKRNPLKN